MKQILIILGLFATVTTFAQSPRIKLNQITKDTVKGSVLISSPSDSGMVYSRDFYVAYGADTVLILYGDTLAATSGIISLVLSDGVTITGDGTSGNELKVDTATVISTIKGLVDTLTNRGYLIANQTITLSGDVTGSGTTAITATVVDDSHNHIISNVDFLQDSLNAKANDSDLANYVTLSGAETITGAKTFTNTFIQNGGDANFDSGTLFVDESANRVGIGTTNPAAVLQLKSDAPGAYGSIIYNTSATGEGLTIRGGSTSSQNALVVQTYNGGQQLLNVRSDGNVGIGVGIPSYTLDVVGDINITGQYLINGSATSARRASDIIVADTFVTVSGVDTITGAKTFTSDLNIDAKIALNDGGNSVFIGDGAGAVDDKSDNRNVGVGSQSLYNNTSGYQNIANGSYALYSNTTGYQNVANGFVALYLNETGYQNIANGYGALRSNTTGYQNTANGFSALYSNTQGYGNIANGSQALYFNTLGDYNIANGRDALFLNTTGNYNVANGYAALYSLSTGSNNIAEGYQAGRYLSDGSTALTNANGSMFLGNNTRASANGNSNEIVIGTDAIGNGSNTITIGSSTTQSLHTRNYEFDIDQTVGGATDNYVLTYDNGDGQISLEPIALSGSATLDFGSTSAQSSSDLTITVTGAADGDVVSLGVPNASVNANTNYTAWVSAANTVTVRFNNYSSGAVDPASGTFKVKVFK